MTAISILATWLALATAAFLMLSALGRAAARRDLEAQLGALGSGESRVARNWGEPLHMQRPWSHGHDGHAPRQARIDLHNHPLKQAA